MSTNNKQKKTKKNQSLLNKLKSTSHKKIKVAIGLIILVIAGSFALGLYRDWENKRFINGLSEDFPRLIAAIEDKTGIELEIKSDCFKTGEKFTEGVSNCGIDAYSDTNDSDKAEIVSVINEDTPFNLETISDDNYLLLYGGADCAAYFRVQDETIKLRLTCIVAPREANEQLALEKLSGDYLNQRKKFYKTDSR